MGNYEPTEETGHLDLASEYGTNEFDDQAFELAISQARKDELLELEQLNR